MKRRAIIAVLRAYEWNQSKAADALGLSEGGLRHVIKDEDLNIDNMETEHPHPQKVKVER
jgi:transcriptional regulator with GAF, ATPase, and Fis domain